MKIFSIIAPRQGNGNKFAGRTCAALRRSGSKRLFRQSRGGKSRFCHIGNFPRNTGSNNAAVGSVCYLNSIY